MTAESVGKYIINIIVLGYAIASSWTLIRFFFLFRRSSNFYLLLLGMKMFLLENKNKKFSNEEDKFSEGKW